MTTEPSREPGLIVPAGTHIVTRVDISLGDDTPLRRRGVVGIIVESPSDSAGTYRIQLPDGPEVRLERAQFSIRKHYASALPDEGAASSVADYQDSILYRCVVGSRAYGLDHAASDYDRRGFFLPPAERHWSIYGVPEQVEDEQTQETYWELQKFLTLALKSNPNVLECLYTPMVEHAAPLAQELLERRAIFLSRRIYQSYNGYVLSQFKKLEQDIRTTGALKWKHAMHLVRLLLSGISALREGAVVVRVEHERERLLAIRDGLVPWEDVNAWRLELHREFDRVFAASKLPEGPDFAAADEFLIRARRSMVK